MLFRSYHMQIARGGSYLGFDRFGAEFIMPDAERVRCLLELIRSGAGDRVVISHDSVWCFRGEPIPPAVKTQLEEVWNPSHFSRRIVPQLLEAGVSRRQIEQLLVDNPRRFFERGALPALA